MSVTIGRWKHTLDFSYSQAGILMSVTIGRWKHTLDLGKLTIALEQGWIQKVWWGGGGGGATKITLKLMTFLE